MAIDRTATLRSAEKLLRQGKLDQAIAEYLRIVEDQPRDWNTANTIGDLYVRAGKPDKAIEQYVASADSLSDEGALSKAAALYKKILKLRPEHEHALLQCAEVAATQGVLVDARTYLKAVAERRLARGDQRGLAQITIRLASLDPTDLQARLAGARARVDVKDQPGAVRDLKEIAHEFSTRGLAAEAIDALREAIALAPDDAEARHALWQAFVTAGDHVSAREHARTSEQLQAIAARLDEQGQHEEALELLHQALAIDPTDARLLARLNRAAPAIEPEPAPESDAPAGGAQAAPADSPSYLEAADARIRAGRLDEGLALVRGMIEREPGRRDAVALFGLSLCDEHPDIAFAVIDLAADAAVAEHDWASAAAGLQELVTRVPMYLPALMRLVEVCVDGGLEATMFSAQAQLADAYLEAGAAAEARYLAEDLVAREPWERANLERFRRALEMLGEPDPDALIAARLSGESPFTSTDVSVSAVRDGGDHSPSWDEEPAQGASDTAMDAAAAEAPGPAWTPDAEPGPPAPADDAQWEIDNHDFEFTSSGIDSPDAQPDDDADGGDHDPAEVDLSVALDEMRPADGAEAGAAAQPAVPEHDEAVPAAAAPPDLEELLGQFRDEAARRSALAAAEEEYSRGVGLHAIGRVDESIPLLTSASRAPRLRFATASLLGRIFRQQGQTASAVEWLEQAAQAPPPSAEEGHLLLYDLADVLETTGEYTRALAVYMELQADSGGYRDVSERVSRLTAMQIRG